MHEFEVKLPGDVPKETSSMHDSFASLLDINSSIYIHGIFPFCINIPSLK